MESGPPTAPPSVAGPMLLSPFRALSLAPHRIGDPASARAFARPYRGVQERLATWRRQGNARLDPAPGIYLHEYTDSGLTVRGLVGCLDISHPAQERAERRILPHEGVHARQVDELARRMGEMRLNPAPILLVHRGPAGLRGITDRLRAGTPEREYTDHAGQEHRIWAVVDPEEQERISSAFAMARLLVADGHHRYAAYVALHTAEQSPETARGLAMIVDHDDTPMFLGAIHRVLHSVRLADLLAAAETAGGQVTRTDERSALATLAPDTLVLTDGDAWATVRVELPPGSAVVQVVDQTLLAGLARPPRRIGYAHSVAEAVARTRPGKVCAALLPAVDFDLLSSVVKAGGLLPEKATSFQPKPSLGTFIRLLDEPS